jgi:membrane associated rhomboid family serine protease
MHDKVDRFARQIESPCANKPSSADFCMSDELIPFSAAALATVGAYERLSDARERGLVVAAMNLPHWVVREGDLFTLQVEVSAREAVLRELHKFESERASQQRLATSGDFADASAIRPRTASLFVAGWIVAGFWLLQNVLGDKWLEAGIADSARIIEQAEWWRTLTALTLHADFAHFAANLAAGLLFAAFMGFQFGGGASWLLIVVSGGLGNLLNAWFYARQPHHSLGASTAVFGALGALMMCDFLARLRTPHSRNRWQLIVPIGAGLGLLAFLGAGDAERQTDYMAHLWGFGAGAFLGLLMTSVPRAVIANRLFQIVAGLTAVLLLALSWACAR